MTLKTFIVLSTFFSTTFSITKIKTVNVDRNGFIYSEGYPNQYVTGNGPLDYYDWMIASKNWLNLVVFFDRLDLNEKDVLQFCTSDQYYSCLDSTGKCAGCVSKPSPFWYPEMGPMFAYYRPFSNSSIITRNGFHAAIVEVDPNSESYFTCGQTYDISATNSQTYFVSQGYPSMTTKLQRCATDIVSTNAIRVRVTDWEFNLSDTFSIYGNGIDGTFQNITFRDGDWAQSVQTIYFLRKATIDFQMQQGTYEGLNFFTLYAEPFNVTTPTCLSFGQQDFVDQEFEIYTPNYFLDTFENYPNNMLCTWRISGITGESQMILEIVGIEMEEGADFFSSTEFDFKISTIDDDFNRYKIGNTLKNASFQITSDALENGLGVYAKLHILDCTCTGGNYTIDSKNSTYRFRMPIDVSGNSRTESYCRMSTTCDWVFKVQSNQNVTLQFTQVDVGYGDVPNVYVDGKFVNTVYDAQTFKFTNKSQIEISWEAVLDSVDSENPFPTGFHFIIYIGDTPMPEQTTTTTTATTTTQSTSTITSTITSTQIITRNSSPAQTKTTTSATSTPTTSISTSIVFLKTSLLLSIWLLLVNV
ncbi:unnamed protein product, partial [Mesorhabditis belari]|uniref:M02D8-5-like second CUB domain-containing protein n=1 Tax=Mesorhabditis belari TaxID=2138241 RepID=A0AAF3E9Z6_9BILA